MSDVPRVEYIFILISLSLSFSIIFHSYVHFVILAKGFNLFSLFFFLFFFVFLLLISGYFPLPAVYCLAWICLDVLFCTASIMHLCTISVDRYLSLRYPMKFGRNKTRRRVILKIIFVWLLSIAMSLPLSLMYSKRKREPSITRDSNSLGKCHKIGSTW
ncbi:hypothetical protein HZH66_004226 [Vespula vulgaris]|uniref:G-protein coupled receptors family 1 profile domain-containing protein n=1 Tax=Vespula vulgaris TaxID=7454 RepID=A0A834NDU6_VESVU|nr:hypothetical protein HZH66_004226 [Vespula vulgaris]